MSKLPSELLDYIIDLLHDNQIPLRNCCLVSKSWTPRSRMYLFAEIEFQTAKSLQSWMEIFPDPSTSPACYAKSLSIGGPQVVTVADAEAGSWIRSFSHVVHFGLGALGCQDPFAREWEAAFVIFRGLSPVVKSLSVKNVAFLPSELFGLIHSFPLLEDLSVIDCHNFLIGNGGGPDGPLSTIIHPSTVPTFTGSLDLILRGGMGHVVRGLLSLPSGLHFRRLNWEWLCKDDIPLAMALVKKCSHTLESLDITDDPRVDPGLASFNLSKATRLRDAVFRPGSLNVEWITRAVQTIAHEHRDLRQISVDVPYHLTNDYVYRDIRRGIFEQWLGLDRILVHLWESLSIRTNVIWTKGKRDRVVGDHIGSLLPEMTKRGMIIVNLVG